LLFLSLESFFRLVPFSSMIKFVVISHFWKTRFPYVSGLLIFILTFFYCLKLFLYFQCVFLLIQFLRENVPLVQWRDFGSTDRIC
jgi:hypothetical protein